MQLRFKPAERFLLFFIVLVACSLVGSIIASLFLYGGISTKSLRIATVVQDCVIFVLPAAITAVLIAPLPANFLGINQRIDMKQLLLAVAAMLVSIPAINWCVDFNENICLPESLKGVEDWMRIHEEDARNSVKILLGSSGIGSLIVDILIVGLLAGFSEEFLFRGAIQQLFTTAKINIHLSIWLTAFIFSAIHMQFFGFFPRLLLGAYFGYLLYWSRSLWLPVIIHALNNSIVVYATWHHNLSGRGAVETEPTLNSWGVGSPMLILASIILTAFIIIRLNNTRKSGELTE